MNLIYQTGATFKDRVANVEMSKADFCVLTAVDGKTVANSIDASLDAGRGKGSELYVRRIDRTVEAGRHQLTIRCQTVHSTPIMALLRDKFAVEGIVELAVQNHGSYLVNGQLGAGESAVWVEDEATGAIVSSRVTSRK